MQNVEAVEVDGMDVTANENIVSAVRELIALQQQARTLGLFTDLIATDLRLTSL